MSGPVRTVRARCNPDRTGHHPKGVSCLSGCLGGTLPAIDMGQCCRFWERGAATGA